MKIKKIYRAISRLFFYITMIAVGFIFLYPLIIMFAESSKDVHDLVNPLVRWLPTHIYKIGRAHV